MNKALSPSPGEEKSAELPADLILEELRQILESEFFRSSTRGKQFLSYVVRYHLEHPSESLKERMIGAALFNRPLDYATGDDSVVRAQAREVRRRLERYYMTHADKNGLRIKLPTGSYTPEFDSPGKPELPPPYPLVLQAEAMETIASNRQSPRSSPAAGRFVIFAGVISILICTGLLLWTIHISSPRWQFSRSVLNEFWSPALHSSKPLLICLPKPVFYRPSAGLYKQTARYPGEFDHEVYRMTHVPHLDPDQAVPWKEMVPYYEFGVSSGDVRAAMRLSSFLGRQDKDNEIRIGEGYTSEDLRNSPAIVIGAYSNPWTIDMTSRLHYSFADDEKGLRIQEQGTSGSSWPGRSTPPNTEYGLITRLLDSSTGQFVVIVAGLTGNGSDAAADMVTNSESMRTALSNAQKDWPQKNMQVVVSTEVVRGVAGPAKVVAVYIW